MRGAFQIRDWVQRFAEIETMLRTQLIRAWRLPEEAVALSLLPQISVPRHLYTTASLPRPHAQVLSPVSPESKTGTHDIPFHRRVR